MTRDQDVPARTHRVVQWAQEHGEVGGVTRTVTVLTDRLRADGLEVSYLDTGSARRAVRGLRAVGGRHTRHIFHITRLWRAIVMAPVFAALPGRSVLVLHSGSTARQLRGMSPGRRRVLDATLRVYDEVWGVNSEIVQSVPPRLRHRVRVVSPYIAHPAVPPTGDRARDPHLLAVATNANQAHYRVDLALAAARRVRQAWPDATLRVLAHGTDGPAMRRLREEVADIPWVVLTWNRPPVEVRETLATTGVFLRPTAWEGDSVIVREALAMGARVVAGDASPRPAGVELSPLDEESLARAVLVGGRPSDGQGLGEVSILDAALDFVRH